MLRKLVWLSTLGLAGGLLATGASAQDYGSRYGAGPEAYQWGPYSGTYGGRGDDYGDQGYAPPRRTRQDESGGIPPQYVPDPRYGDDRGQPYPPPNAPAGHDAYWPRGFGPREAYADPYYGGGYGRGPYGDPYGAQDPYHHPSDTDLREGSQEMTKAEVDNPTAQPPGTIVINTAERHLYYVEPNGKALQYGIGVGREGFAWKGVAQIKRKQEWPDWIPPSDMLKRRPDLPLRMSGGIDNPLGARAMYLFKGNKDTMFRIHGTNEPDSIGKAMSSGCIRMMNNDVIDLYSRVPVGTKVVVL